MQWFIEQCGSTFRTMDFDGDGALTTTDIYCAVLLLYTKIISVASPPRDPRRCALAQGL